MISVEPAPENRSAKSVSFELDEFIEATSFSEAQLLEAVPSQPVCVLEEVHRRLGLLMSEPAGLHQKVVSFFAILERMPWFDLSDMYFARFSQVLVQMSVMAPAQLPLTFRVVLNEAPMRRSVRCESLISQILKFIPASMPVLLSSLEFYFPHQSRPSEQILSYSELLVALMRMMPGLRPKIMDLMIVKFLAIDVAIQLEASNLPEALELDATEEDFSSEEVEEYEVMDSDLLRRSASPIAMNVGEMMAKLDGSLGMLFALFKDFNETELKSAFGHLLQSFERSILPTFRSRSVPSLVFYASSLDASLQDVFLGFLVKRLYHVFDDPSDGKRKKSSSTSASLLTVITASYLGSYVSRAKFLTDNLVRLSFDMLLTWTLRFLGDLPNHMRSGGMKSLRIGTNHVTERTAVFYAVAQAIMYILCFRHKLLLSDPSSRSNYRNFLLPILQSPLNPLKWCLQAVVEEFIQICDQYDLIDCRAIVEKGSRRSAPPTNKNESATSEMYTDRTGSFLGDVDSYFPFDPLILKQCSSFISSDLYNDWTVSHEDGYDDVNEVESEFQEDLLSRELLLCNPAWQSLAVRKRTCN